MKAEILWGAGIGVSVFVILSMVAVHLSQPPGLNAPSFISREAVNELPAPSEAPVVASTGEGVSAAEAISAYERVKRAVHSGDFALINTREALDPQEAAAIPQLLSEIPSSLDMWDRTRVIVKLLVLLRNTPGDDSSRALVAFLTLESASANATSKFFSESIRCVEELGRRRFSEASQLLELWAFPWRVGGALTEKHFRTKAAVEALLLIDSERYLPAVASLVPRLADSDLETYIDALRPAADLGDPIVGSLASELQNRYHRLPVDNDIRLSILSIVGGYGRASSSNDLRRWAIEELRNLIRDISTQKSEFPEILELIYKAKLRELEGTSG